MYKSFRQLFEKLETILAYKNRRIQNAVRRIKRFAVDIIDCWINNTSNRVTIGQIE